ncbi:MAG: hypothetical protein ACU84H_02685 [Gammaproteobacteria bacterium]
MKKKVSPSIGLWVFILIAGFAKPGYADPIFSGYDNRISPGNFSRLIAGTYIVSRDPMDGPSYILTIFADGNLSSIQSIQFEGGAGDFPFSNQQGAWIRTGNRKVTAAVLNMNYLSTPGGLRGIAIATYTLEFSKNFRTVTGESNGRIYAPGVDPQNPGNAATLDTFTDQFTAKRVIVANDD